MFISIEGRSKRAAPEASIYLLNDLISRKPAIALPPAARQPRIDPAELQLDELRTCSRVVYKSRTGVRPAHAANRRIRAAPADGAQSTTRARAWRLCRCRKAQ